MRKIVLFTALAAASIANAALSDAEILQMFGEAKHSGVEVKVVKREKIAGNYEQIVVEFKKDGASQKQAVFTDGNYVFPDIIDVKNKTSYGYKFDKAQEQAMMKDAYKKLASVLKSLDKSKIISLGSDASKPTRYVFTDPHCPYCRDALGRVEDNLKTANLKIVLAPIQSHGDGAVAKSIAIENEVKSAKSDAEKIAIMRKYYAEDAATPNIDAAKIKSAKVVIEKIFATGAIRGVPAFIDAADLK